jgi:hypothetical protein
MLWRMEEEGFNHQVWHWMNINIMPLHILSWWVTIFPQCLVSSKWTQCIRFLMNFIALHWTTLLVRLQLHNSSTSKRVLWVHIFMLKVCKNASQGNNQKKAKKGCMPLCCYLRSFVSKMISISRSRTIG